LPEARMLSRFGGARERSNKMKSAEFFHALRC
jgi:hypothetical protein